MFSTKPVQVVVTLLLAALLATSALPTRRSATDTGSRRTTSSSSGSGSGGRGGPCNVELTEREREALIDEIEDGLHGLINVLQGVHLWSLRATVGIYGTIETIFDEMINENGTCSALASEYGYAIARSVSYFQMFVRPVGDVLTNETVREVIYHESGFTDEFSITRSNLTVVAKGAYKLVKGYRNIHECVLPSLPLATDDTPLKPRPPLNVSGASHRDMVVDGIASELQKLAADMLIALNCFF